MLPGQSCARPSSPISTSGAANESLIFDHDPRMLKTVVGLMVQTMSPEVCQVCRLLPARVGLAWIAALNRINRGPTRVLTEVPVRLLYIVIQLGFEVLDRLFGSASDPLSNLVVARRTSGPARPVLPSMP